jgi:hypothetical protein
MAVGIVCSIVFLALDEAHVRSLLWRSDMPVTATLMLMAACACTFGGLVCAAAVMMAGQDDDIEPPRGRRKFRAGPRSQLATAATGVRRGR